MGFKVVQNERLRGKDYLLKVEAGEELLLKVKPGQFAMVQVRDSRQFDPLLRRPLGIFDREGETVSFIYRVFGRGTELLTEFKPGEELEILMPLGNFIPDGFQKYLFIAGGIGIGGLFLGAKEFLKRGKEVLLLYGERSLSTASALPIIEENSIPYVLYTEDGSGGKEGFVTRELDSFTDYVWIACGPTPMLKAVREKALELGVKCYLSLDRRMACGVGACLGCTVETVSGYKRCCVEGPIFPAEEVLI
ncbi:MAG: dihydroorotate dehydrogenase electron transfer subunit [Desulfurobacteriaceae bacterium]